MVKMQKHLVLCFSLSNSFNNFTQIINIEDLKKQTKMFLIVGPCAIESEEISFEIAERISRITKN